MPRNVGIRQEASSPGEVARNDVQVGYAVADFNNKQVTAGQTTTLNLR
jgi:hypothetical protein